MHNDISKLYRMSHSFSTAAALLVFTFSKVFEDLHFAFDVVVHPSCMDLSEELARRAARSPWQCIDCKTCNVCDDSGYAVSLIDLLCI